MSKRAFVDPKVIDGVTAEGMLPLDEATKHRFLRVLRLTAGTFVELLDGTGRIARGLLETKEPVHLRQVQVEFLPKSGPVLVLAQALVKMDKLEQVVQRTTELGVDEIIFFDAARSQVHFHEKVTQKLERLNKIAGEAARQSERADTPELLGPYSFLDLCKMCRDFAGLKVMGDLNASKTLPMLLSEDSSPQSVLLIVGPEGGLSPEELSELSACGVVSVKWNANVLRTETAGMAAVAVIRSLLQS